MAPDPLTIDRLERWAFFGAHWRVVELSPDHVVVDMCACTGELVERIESADSGLIEYLQAAPNRRDGPPGPGVNLPRESCGRSRSN